MSRTMRDMDVVLAAISPRKRFTETFIRQLATIIIQQQYLSHSCMITYPGLLAGRLIR